jgi:hypothetical protein
MKSLLYSVAIVSFVVGIISAVMGVVSYKVAWDISIEASKTQRAAQELLAKLSEKVYIITGINSHQLDIMMNHIIAMNRKAVNSTTPMSPSVRAK